MTLNEVLVAEGSTRDPLRVPHALSALAHYWTKVPNKSIGRIAAEVGSAFAQDPAELEDEVFFDHLKLNTPEEAPETEANPIVGEILSALDAFWMQNQDLRLGEILAEAAVVENTTITQLEDADFLDYLKKNAASWN